MVLISPELKTDADIVRQMNCRLHALKPPPDFSVADWADHHRRLPKKSSSEPGQWRTSRTPYLREIMEELSPRSHTVEVVFMKGSQLGATEVLINTALYYIAHDPCPILLVEPTVHPVAERVSKQRVQPSIELCPEVVSKVGEQKSRQSGNTLLEKDFPGGTLIIGGANSAASMRSMPIRVLLMDEVDGYPEDVDGEGDPAELAEQRTTNFSRRKILYISTPTVAESSRISAKFNESDMRYYYVPCPFCKEMQIIKWSNIKWEDRDPDTAHLVCEHCKETIYEHHKTWMLEHGEWRKHNPESKVAGFHLSGLYSPIGWKSWKQIVRKHLKALGDPNKRKAWTNTDLGEVWEEMVGAIDEHWLAKRKEPYAAEVPAGVRVLTCGADTQDDRVELFVWGWGQHQESWLIDYMVIYGDPALQSLWDQVTAYIQRRFTHESGAGMNIAATCIDAMGHYTDEVYTWCRDNKFRRVFPVQGKSTPGRAIVSRATMNKRAGVYLWQLGVDAAKETIYTRLKQAAPGPGHVHFPTFLPNGADGKPRELPESFFAGITAEKCVTRHSAGLPRRQWILPKGKRNEPLDGFVYALSALQILNPTLDRLSEDKPFTSDFSTQVSTRSRLGRRVRSMGVSV